VAVALETGKPIYVSKEVWDKVSDMTSFLQELKKKFASGETGDEEGESGEEKDEGEGNGGKKGGGKPRAGGGGGKGKK
jgi:hypothetical protein